MINYTDKDGKLIFKVRVVPRASRSELVGEHDGALRVRKCVRRHAEPAARAAGWAGSQRYPIGWGGDPQSDWEGLAASLRGGLSWGMSGNPYHSSDIGGFYGAAQPTAELYVRWLQASVFSSHIRKRM